MKANKLDELNTTSYAKAMDSTENFPFAQMLAGDNKDFKNRADKMANVNSLAKRGFEASWNKEFKGTPITFIGKKTNKAYTYPVFGLKFNANYTNFDILLSTDGDLGRSLIWVKNPLYIDQHGMEKIAPEPVTLDPKSREMFKKMFSFGFSADHASRGQIGESIVEKIMKEAVSSK